jgi:pyruvate dehydrogenase E1 component alpha subunit
VRRAPVVLVCQNNGWAISTPWALQSASETVAARAEGYGMPGVLIDGNDVLATYEVTRQARARALAGGGPTLIEAVTTRLGAHTTADDPTRYLTPEQAEAARALDPIARFAAWLRATDRWDDEAQALALKWCDGEIDRAVEEFDATPKPAPGAFFEDVYADEPQRLRRQRERFQRERAEG